MHIVYTKNTSTWETRFLKTDALTPVRFPWMTPCRLVYMHRRSVDNRCFHLQGVRTPLKVEAAGSRETATFVYQTTKISHSRKIYKKRLFLLFAWVHFLPHGGNICLFYTALLFYFKRLLYRKSSDINTPVCLSLSLSSSNSHALVLCCFA